MIIPSIVLLLSKSSDFFESPLKLKQVPYKQTESSRTSLHVMGLWVDTHTHTYIQMSAPKYFQETRHAPALKTVLITLVHLPFYLNKNYLVTVKVLWIPINLRKHKTFHLE